MELISFHTRDFSPAFDSTPLTEDFQFIGTKNELENATFTVSGEIIDTDTNIPLAGGDLQAKSHGKVIGITRINNLGSFSFDIPYCFVNDIHLDLSIQSMGYRNHGLIGVELMTSKAVKYSSEQLRVTIRVKKS